MDELTELQHDSSTAEATAPPDFRAMFQSVVSESGLATSEEVSALRGEINALSQRLVAVEATVADLPKTYASADSVSKVRASQVSYQSSQHKLTKQVAELANVVADSGRKYANIETRLNELPALRTALEQFTDHITLFTSNQRERGDHHEARMSNIERRTNELAGDVTFLRTDQDDTKLRYTQTITPIHDFIHGSSTQKPLKETLSHFETTLNTLNTGQVHQSTVLKSLEDYWKAQQAKEEARRNFYQKARIQLATPRGLIAILIVVIGVIALMNAFSFDQLIARIQQLAGVVQLLLGK